MIPPLSRLRPIAVAIVGVAAITALYGHVAAVNPTTVALSYLVMILLLASRWGLTPSTLAAVLATLAFNVFFLPPVGVLTIADPQNWISFLAFMVTASVASQLSGRARQRQIDAIARQADLERLYAFSRSLLLSDNSSSLQTDIARGIATAFDLPAVALYDRYAGTLAQAGPSEIAGVVEQLQEATRRAVSLRTPAGLIVATIRLGGEPIGALALQAPSLSDTVLQSIANLAAIGLERARGREAASRAEAARQSGELRATVLDALAHEFKTPLTSIKAAAGDLLSTRSLAAREHELVTIVDEEATRLQVLVTDAIQMLRIETIGFTLNRARHSLIRLVTTSLAELGSRLDGHQVETHVPADLTVDADGELLRLAFRQLLDNAVKYSPPTSTIEVSASTNSHVEIAVRNSGSVIPDRERTRIFDRFYRGTDARHVPGTGMGLAIVQQIARAHGGAVTVSASPPDSTVFTVSLAHGVATS